MPAHRSQNSGEPYQEKRRYRRFDLQFPVHLRFPSSANVHELRTISRNISIGGLLLKAADSPPPQIAVSFMIELQGPPLRRLIQLLGDGQVVRVERLEASIGFAIAIECKRPIAEIENLVPASG